MNKVDIVAKYCKGCGYCIHFCPKQILKMGNVRNQKGHFYPYIEEMEKCIGCQSCAIVCPEGAIELYKGVEENG